MTQLDKQGYVSKSHPDYFPDEERDEICYPDGECPFCNVYKNEKHKILYEN